MGNGESTVDTHNVSHRSDLHYRVQQNMPIKLPMPDPPELERRFTQVLASMDLPPDKAKLLKQYDDEKKWDLICDQERVHVKDQPSTYVNKLRTYLDPKASRSSRRRRMLGDSSSTQVLRDLEISLRTNHIEWVREFLNEENQGLDILVDYLSFRQVVMRREQKLCRSASFHGTTSNGTISRVSYTDSPQLRRAPKVSHKLNMGEARDDVHVCILCLRAIMNNKYGFNMVISHTQAINCIALSLNHRSLRTKALVLELLAAICLVKGGHEIILAAFENFQEVCSEKRRFETLMKYFKEYEEFNIDFMVACMQFVNIVVHSVEDMNFRVHLQFEFTKLGLDDYLEKLRHTESEELLVQISAYFDNVFDVAALMEDSETKNMALEKVAELEEQLSLVTERMQEIENESMAAIVDLENRLVETQREKDEVLQKYIQIDQELASLKQAISEKEEESRKRQSMLDYKIQELESLRSTVKVSGSSDSSSTSSSPARETPPIAPPPPPPPPPPGPPPVLVGRGPPVPPPPPGGLDIPGDAMTIKKRVQTKYKLPVLNWVPLKPNQVKGTVFNELDDERLFEVIDFNFFEEQFKTGVLSHSAGEGDITPKFNKTLKKPETVILLELNRLRNIAISLRKIELTTEEIVRAINSLDLKILQLDYVETLLRMRPNEQEVKMYREYEKDRRPLSVLSDEDKFMMQLSKVERLSQKLHIMSFVGTFFENIHLITPQVHAIIAAARAVKNSKKIRKILEIILAFGNYMNSNKRGPAYGFKLQGLDLLLDLKSTDKKITLMHYLVQTIREKFPDLLNFECELMYVEKAAIVSLENILTDLHELEKGMEMTKREYEFRKDSKDTAMLKEFLSNSEDKLRKLKSDCKQAQEAYKDVVEYFGESVRTIAPTVFFSLFVRFAKAFKQAETDNDNRKKLELAAQNNNTLQEVARKNRANRKNNQLQDAVITELRNKTQKVKDKKLLPKDEVYHGALEDILLGLKNQPYRRADAVRRSQRRKQNDVRYSHAMDDLDL